MADEIKNAIIGLRHHFKALGMDAPAMILLRDQRQGYALRQEINAADLYTVPLSPQTIVGDRSGALWWQITLHGIIVRWPANATAEGAVTKWCDEAGAQP